MRRRTSIVLGGTSSPDQLATRWVLWVSEERATLYAAAQEVDLDQQLWDASAAVFQDTGGLDGGTLCFLCADGKAQVLIANCRNWRAEAPRASVCWVCRCNTAQCLTNFGLKDTIDGWWESVLPMEAIYRNIAAGHRIRTTGCTW